MFGDVDRHGTRNWPFQAPGGFLSSMPPAHVGAHPTLMPPGSPTLSSGQSTAAAGGQSNANVWVAILVGISLFLLLSFHLLGFRFGFDVSVGRS